MPQRIEHAITVVVGYLQHVFVQDLYKTRIAASVADVYMPVVMAPGGTLAPKPEDNPEHGVKKIPEQAWEFFRFGGPSS